MLDLVLVVVSDIPGDLGLYPVYIRGNERNCSRIEECVLDG